MGRSVWIGALVLALAACGVPARGEGTFVLAPEAGAPAGGGGGEAAPEDPGVGLAAPPDLTGRWGWGAGEPPVAGTAEACDDGAGMELWQADQDVGGRVMACDGDDCWPAEQLAGTRAGDRLTLAGWEAPPPGTRRPATRLRYDLAWDPTTAQWRGTRNGTPVWLTGRAECPAE